MDSKKDTIKLAIVNRWFFPKDQGGIPMYNWNLLKGLSNKISLSIITVKDQMNEEFYRSHSDVEFIYINPIRFSLIEKFCRFNWMKNALRSFVDYLYSLKFSKVLMKRDFQFVEFMDIHSEGYVYLKNKKKYGLKSRVIVRSHTPWGILKSTYSKNEILGVDSWFAVDRERYCFQTADIITVPSLDLKIRIMEFYGINSNRIKLIFNSIDTNHFCSQVKSRNINEFVILHVGRFEYAKGVITLINAFISFVRMFPNSRLQLAGQARGDAYNESIEYLSQNDILNKVDFLGFVPYNDLPELYANSDVVVVPSKIYESFSYTVVQSLSCHRPVIASRIGGIPETIGNCGLLFDFNSKDDLLKCLVQIIETPQKYSYDQCIENFKINQVASEYLEMLME